MSVVCFERWRNRAIEHGYSREFDADDYAHALDNADPDAHGDTDSSAGVSIVVFAALTRLGSFRAAPSIALAFLTARPGGQ